MICKLQNKCTRFKMQDKVTIWATIVQRLYSKPHVSAVLPGNIAQEGVAMCITNSDDSYFDYNHQGIQ